MRRETERIFLKTAGANRRKRGALNITEKGENLNKSDLHKSAQKDPKSLKRLSTSQKSRTSK